MVSCVDTTVFIIKTLFHTILIYLFFAFGPILLDIEPTKYNLTLPQTFDGPLTANNKLSQADHLFVNEIIGPESLAVWKGDVYTGVSDGRIIRIRKDHYKTIAQFGDPLKCVNPWEMERCGRPLGMRFDSKGLLYVADAYYGIHTVNVTSGKVKRILTSKRPIDNIRPLFVDDLVISEEEQAIYFTDASNKWDLKNVFYTVGEHDETGRVIRFDLKSKNSTVIMKSLGFPNGIELSDDRTTLYVCEFNNRRIMKHFVDGDRRGQTDVFALNLPGEPDNIRRSSDPFRETYWVALAMGRNEKNPSFAMDMLSNWPKTRKALLRVMHTVGTVVEYFGKLIYFRPLIELGFKTKSGSIIFHTITNYGMAVELDTDGNIIQSLHSPDGRTTLLSEVREVVVGDQKVLYLGSYGNNYIGKVSLGQLTKINRPLLTHEKKKFIDLQKKNFAKRSTDPKPYKPYKAFDLQNPDFGQHQQQQQQYDQSDYRFDPDFQKAMKMRQMSKNKSKSKVKSKSKSKTKAKANSKTKSTSKSKTTKTITKSKT